MTAVGRKIQSRTIQSLRWRWNKKNIVLERWKVKKQIEVCEGKQNDWKNDWETFSISCTPQDSPFFDSGGCLRGLGSHPVSLSDE